jgi:hypothetical protein
MEFIPNFTYMLQSAVAEDSVLSKIILHSLFVDVWKFLLAFSMAVITNEPFEIAHETLYGGMW